MKKSLMVDIVRFWFVIFSSANELYYETFANRRATLIGQMKLIAMSLVNLHSSIAGAEQPNLVLVMADDQGWGDTGYNGHPELKKPNLDAMAASGLRLNRFYAAHFNCSPTRASVMTGRHPHRMGTFGPGSPIRAQEVTVAKALQSAGYATGHFGE